jgi:hypothetical protein
MQIDIAALFEGQKGQQTTQQPQAKVNFATVPTTNLIDLTDLDIIASEDHEMTLENEQPTSSGRINTQPAPPV